MKHTEWKQYMHETAERARRQIKAMEHVQACADICVTTPIDFATIEARVAAVITRCPFIHEGDRCIRPDDHTGDHWIT